jgi:hypothetical protein
MIAKAGRVTRACTACSLRANRANATHDDNHCVHVAYGIASEHVHRGRTTVQEHAERHRSHASARGACLARCDSGPVPDAHAGATEGAVRNLPLRSRDASACEPCRKADRHRDPPRR